MRTYESIREAVAELKSKTGHGHVAYFVNGRRASVAEYRAAEGPEFIYRSGLEIHAEKNDEKR